MTKTNSNNTERIRRKSRLFILLLQSLMIVVPIIDCTIWVFMNDLLPLIQHELLPEFARLPLPPMARFLRWCVSLIPLTIFLWGNITLIKLFRLYEQGHIFSGENVRCFSQLSNILIAWCVVGILVDPLQSIALTLHHPPGHRLLALGVNSIDVTILLVAGIFGIISRVMEEARQIKEEQELTI